MNTNKLEEKQKITKKNDVRRDLKDVLFVVFSGLWIIFVGIGMLFVKDGDNIEMHTFGLLFIALGGGYLMYYLIRIFTVKDFLKKQREKQKRRYAQIKKDNPYHYQLLHPYAKDVNVLKILKKNFILSIPFILSIISIIAFLVFEVGTHYVFDAIKSLNFGLWGLLMYLYLLSFGCFSLFILGYLALGEVLQRYFYTAKRHLMTDMVINFIYAIPFIAILSLCWVIFLFVAKREDDDSFPSSFEDIRWYSWYVLLKILKYYTYINLAIIAFEDRHKGIPFKESSQYLKNERVDLFLINLQSGLLMVILFGFFVSLDGWNQKFNFISIDMYWSIASILFGLVFIWSLFSEQFSFLLHFIRTRHKECDVDSLQ